MSAEAAAHADAPAIAAAVRADLDQLATFSLPGLGVTRVAFGDDDARSRTWFKEQCQRIGLEFRADLVGNCIGFTPGAARRQPLLIGSHLDSVVNGGKFDGVLGVVVGLRVVEWLHRHRSDLPLAVANFSCEESTRFGFGSIGSRFFVGELTEDQFDGITDVDGLSLATALGSAGFEDLGERVDAFRVAFRGYLEVHIDQGTVLTSLGATLGVVTRIAGVHRTQLVWNGQEAHSGGRARSDRRDALVAAAEFVVRANEEWAARFPDEQRLAFTVGRFSVEPNSPNTVPGRVEMILDIRSADEAATESMRGALTALADDIAARHRVTVEGCRLGQVDPVSMHDVLIDGFALAAEVAALPSPRCISLAGHDALVIGRVIPSGMLLLANPTGISHSPDEGVDDQAVVDCIAVLLGAVPALVATLRPQDEESLRHAPQ